MRIDVLADDLIGAQARTYAEYRLFAALSQVLDLARVRSARLVLHTARSSGGVSCTVSVEVGGVDVLLVRTTGAHPYAAINDAMERLRDISGSDLRSGGVAESPTAG